MQCQRGQLPMAAKLASSTAHVSKPARLMTDRWMGPSAIFVATLGIRTFAATIY
jgi:hypothetical protein